MTALARTHARIHAPYLTCGSYWVFCVKLTCLRLLCRFMTSEKCRDRYGLAAQRVLEGSEAAGPSGRLGRTEGQRVGLGTL